MFSTKNPLLDSTFQVVERSSESYRSFIRDRIEANFTRTDGPKQSACLLCWAFITATQKRRHLEHEPYIVTASFFKNEESFIKLCRENGKLSGNQQRIILFKDHCQFAGLDPQASMGSNAGRVTTYAGGENPVTSMTQVQKKQFEFDFQLKRIQTVAGSLKEEYKASDKVLSNLETQIGILQQQVQSYVRERQILSEPI